MKSLRGFLSLRDLDVLHRARPLRVALEVGGDAEAGVRRRRHLMFWAGIVQGSRRHGGKRWYPCRFSLSVTNVRNRGGWRNLNGLLHGVGQACHASIEGIVISLGGGRRRRGHGRFGGGGFVWGRSVSTRIELRLQLRSKYHFQQAARILVGR